MTFTKFISFTLVSSAVWFCAVCIGAVHAQDELLQAEPFDELLLNGETKTLKLVPIEMKQRRPLSQLNLKAADDIIVRLLEKPSRPYKVKWSEVKRLRLFEEILLETASKLVAGSQFDRAVDYYLLLESKFAGFPGVAEGYQKCLFSEAGFWARKAKFEQSFVLLNELYQRNPQYTGIGRALDVTVNKIVEQRIADGNFEAARMLLDELEKKFPESEIVKTRRQEMVGLAEQVLADAKKSLADGQMRTAFMLTTESIKRWPALAGSGETLKAINEKYPIVIVGVEQDKITTGDPVFGDWVARRQQRLTGRLVAEAEGYQSSAGANYQMPFVSLESDDQETKFILRDGLQWSGGRAVDADDLAAFLLKRSPEFSISPLSGLSTGSLKMKQVDARTISLQISGLPAGFAGRLQGALQPWDASAGGAEAIFAPYTRVISESGGSSFVANQKYFALHPAQPLEIIEQRVGSAGAAIRGLRQGDFVAVDRIASWDLEKFNVQKDLDVLPYAAPTVCLLFVNPHSRTLPNVSRRRAIAFGINRQLIVAGLFPQGESHAKLISGPFPHGYAYHDQIAETEYDPRQFLLMSQIAEDAPATANSNEPSIIKPDITLALPVSPRGRRVCGEIQKHLQLGANVKLRELTDQFDPVEDRDWDLLYVEAFAMDPVADVFRLFGEGSFTGITSPFLQSMLDRLSAAKDLAAASVILRELHAHLQAQQLVIPLWEITEFFAKSKQLQGCANERVSFYQDIEQWRYSRD